MKVQLSNMTKVSEFCCKCVTGSFAKDKQIFTANFKAMPYSRKDPARGIQKISSCHFEFDSSSKKFLSFTACTGGRGVRVTNNHCQNKVVTKIRTYK